MPTRTYQHANMLRTQIQLEKEDFDRLRSAAERKACSVSAFVRDSVRAALDASERASIRDRVQEVAGKYRSGKRDLARNHDAYLENGW
jgi:hypothetical protein